MLLSVQVFIIGGYRLVLNYFEQKADISLVKKLDSNNYNDAELVTVKIPLNLPYINNWSDFERCDGTIKINGVFYNYVNRKLSGDTLILQCIANNKKNKLNKINSEYAKTAGDAQPSSSNEKTAGSLLKLFFFEYNYNTGYNLSANSFALSYMRVAVNDNTICSPFIASPIKPPETI